MEETKAATPAPAPGMDVVAPPPAESRTDPMAVKAAPPDEDKKGQPAPAPKDIPKEPAKPKFPKPPKEPGSGVGTAIIATVVIVLALAAMATYAYIKTQK